MVETITPVVHGGRRPTYWLSIALHVAGATGAAALFGAALGLVGLALGAPWGPWGATALAAVGGLYALREFLRLPVPIPDRRRQVPDWWRTFFSPPVASTLYGLGLGVGFLTFLSFGTFVAVAVGAVASGEPLVGALVCAPFGLARGVSVMVAAGADDAATAASIVDRLEEIAATALPRLVNAAALAGVAAVAVIGS